ncbi:hypothetical protein MKW94_012744 [Papaver nudicaule]|uniref:Uncharacterized protein n=1 Tax=Papaver nudicaule TaxID=74823 RepID=A0AA41W1K1_PAPNU|nr:hypothetical protein [Papaver nudicaule]
MEVVHIQLVIFVINTCIGLATLYKSPLITMLLILSLSLYSGLEGIAIGVEDNQADPWRSLWDIPLYKLQLAIGMGSALFKLFADRPFLASLAYLLVSIVASPIGVAIGTRIDATTESKVADRMFVINAGFATGIFFYDAIQNVYNGSKPRKPDYLRVFASGLAGVGVLAVAMFCV